jgi:hypothetical protein
LIELVPLPPTHYVKETKRFRSTQGIDIMVLGGWKIAAKLRWHLRRQEAPLGAIFVMLLAATTAAVTYLYY